ncbi:uncharacterized protein F4822DRAFT_440000 [Hypoxylon trugodes]|uniref:uncharacterized protein n=1 Tax=Hypoxylon trugodes TaxID=326681 RepID=UPI0021973147|nr:uncharacterized protein F4822DRAFT_440000 [Hypoxylon trugodes]KAI1383738.1 hypothetical protein F4822DRAFT_440000 [Hypoxylon trugodes]
MSTPYLKKIEEEVDIFYSNWGRDFPKYKWDWRPFLRAICEGNVLAGGPSTIRRPDPEGEIAPGNAVRATDSLGRRKVIRKPAGSGSWQYAWYIPEWSHPNFEPDIDITYTGKASFSATNRAPYHKLFPALRNVDQVRRPTAYAQRFGIHPDEQGGRSRLSPTISSTRDPFDDYANQVNSLPEEVRQAAIDESNRLRAQEGNIPPEQSNYIHPQVMDAILRKEGALTGAQLKKLLEVTLAPGEKSMNLDKFVDTLNAKQPNILDAHRTFLAKALDDQNYQRTLFQDLTSDEMLYDNIYTQSNDVYCDLKGPIHPHFDRNHWMDSDAKGAVAWQPRLVYNLNGERGEWDVRRNDKVWEALQPALQMVTRVLNSEHPHIKALMDLRTRTKVDPARDGRINPKTTHITKYDDIDKIDLSDTWNEILTLAAMGFDWPLHVNKVLEKCLTIDLGSCFMEPTEEHGPDTVDGAKDAYDMSYGFTYFTNAGPDSQILMSIGAELVWPLLMPQYSQSEKLSASFAIASTILHEYGHAISNAHMLIMSEECFGRTTPQGDAAWFQLVQLGIHMYDYDSFNGEHPYKDNPTSEHGFEIEVALWGGLALNLVANLSGHNARISSAPLITSQCQWPFSRAPNTAGEDRDEPIAGGDYAVEDYFTPIPIDYMARFFTQKFWDGEFKLYGFEALKMLPPNHAYKLSMNPQWIDKLGLAATFGWESYSFILFAYRTLGSNDQAILGHYILAVVYELMMPRSFVDRWRVEIRNWDDEMLTPLEGSVERLTEVMGEAQSTKAKLEPADEDRNYWLYVQEFNLRKESGRASGVPADQVGWKNTMKAHFVRYFRDGGLLMQALAETHRLMSHEIRFLQRMIFDFFSINPEARGQFYSGNGSNDNGILSSAYERMLIYRGRARDIWESCQKLSQADQLIAVKEQWSSWATHYKACFNMYGDLLGMLGEQNQFNPDDMSWKGRFPSVPSSYWKSRVERLRSQAQREYNRVHPAIREVVDECMNICWRVGRENLGKIFLSEPDLDEVEKVLQKARYLGKDAPPNAQSAFNWSRPNSSTEPSIFDNTWQSSSRKFRRVIGSSSSETAKKKGVVFGQANTIGAHPPRRPGDARPSPASGSGVGASSKGKEKDISGSALGPDPSGGIRRDHSNPFAKYHVEGQAGSGFVQASAKFGAIVDLENIGVPTVTIDSALGTIGVPSTFGDGGPFYSSIEALNTKFPFTMEMIGKKPLGNAFAGPYTMSTEVADHEQTMWLARALTDFSGIYGNPLYLTEEPWRGEALADALKTPPPSPPLKAPFLEPPPSPDGKEVNLKLTINTKTPQDPQINAALKGADVFWTDPVPISHKAPGDGSANTRSSSIIEIEDFNLGLGP